MIRFVKHNDINPEKWNATLQTSQFRTIFCSYNILDELTRGGHWNALILDDYQYIMPLPKRSKLGVSYIYTPFFLPQMGIFSAHPITSEIVAEFIQAIPKKYKQVDALLNISNDISNLNTHTLTLISHQLDLNTSREELFSHYAQNTQRNIKSAQKQNLIFETQNVKICEIIDLFVQNKGKENIVHFKADDYKTLEIVAEQLLKMERLDVVGTRNATGQLIAGTLFVKDFDRIWFWFSGRDNQFSKEKPMFFLLDEYIKTQAGKPMLLDFNGSTNENVARLYKGFGGQPYDIHMLNFSQDSCLHALLNIYRKIKS